MPADHPRDPFRECRRKSPVLSARLDGDVIPMILRHRDVREAAKNWQTFSSDVPFRVPIPSEESVRSVRQLPIETDPPEHTDYRKIVEPFFKRPNQPEYGERIGRLVDAMLDGVLAADSCEVVGDFALPLQSRALTYLLDVPESEAEEWIGWGVHVFRVGDGEKKGENLEAYIHRQLDRATAAPGDDFFSALVRATYRGRPLSREEMSGFANLTFAGGRDTVINSVTTIIAYFGHHPERLDWLREDPRRIAPAGEEFVRYATPLTHIGRVCPVDTDVHGTPVRAGERVSLCWASANYDETVFENPDEVRLDRKPNPHVAFGSGVHACLGAPHARVIIRTLLDRLCQRIGRIEVLSFRENVEKEADYERPNAFERLEVRMIPR